jgi:hypothetical protein
MLSVLGAIAPLFIIQASASATTATEKVPNLFAEVDGWYVFKSPEYASCSMRSNYEKGALSIHWYPRKKSVSVITYFKDFASIKEDKEYKIKVYFQRNGRIDDGWGERTATGFVDTDGDKGLMFFLPGEVALNDLASNSVLGIEYNGEIIGGFNLTSTGKAIAQIRRCEMDILKAHPIDPFEE